jgi:hypothetical protein
LLPSIAVCANPKYFSRKLKFSAPENTKRKYQKKSLDNTVESPKAGKWRVGAGGASKIKFSLPSIAVCANPKYFSWKLRFSIPENAKRKYSFENRLTTQPNRPRLTNRGWEQAAR